MATKTITKTGYLATQPRYSVEGEGGEVIRAGVYDDDGDEPSAAERREWAPRTYRDARGRFTR